MIERHGQERQPLLCHLPGGTTPWSGPPTRSTSATSDEYKVTKAAIMELLEDVNSGLRPQADRIRRCAPSVTAGRGRWWRTRPRRSYQSSRKYDDATTARTASRG
ncbi:MAG: hypothetical protein MZU91_06895 [Desulfosudis oleivorans]|nr:hypothetical protein [Desulfosudis oleivorans]